MTEQEARDWVARIEAMKWDDEAAHYAEDALYESFVRAIADGSGKHSKVARIILGTKAINFARWYA